jgi:hypothetical protein
MARVFVMVVKVRFRIKRNSHVVHNETREGVFFTRGEFGELGAALLAATRVLETKG